MKRIIVTRFSAMGDVAMVASVLKEFSEQNPETEIIMVSRKLYSAFFDHIPNLTFHTFDPNGNHKGLNGLIRLFNELKSYKAYAVADLHNNIRTNVLNFLFKLTGCKVKQLDKGRKEKKELTRKHNKIKKQLKLTTERYADVLRALGFTVQLSHQLKKDARPIPSSLKEIINNTNKNIGIAPFAQHSFKVFPLTKMEEVIKYLSTNNVNIFVFGGGKEEQIIVENWSKNFTNVFNTIGNFKISQELDIISHLDIMISMDSSGMHMASLVGTPVVSIWGATHPYAGFLGYGQSYENCIHVEHENRPNSVYGNKSCDCNGIEAINLVSSQMVIDKLLNISL